jgi:ketosteroid isomerase-like protein
MKEAEKIITNLEKEWMEAWIQKDTAKCNEILSDDFLLSSARGTLINKKEWLAAAGNLIVGEEFNWLEIKIRIYGNTAVVNAKTTQKAHVGGEDWSGMFLITDVWVFQNDKWQVVTRHGTGPLSENKQN